MDQKEMASILARTRRDMLTNISDVVNSLKAIKGEEYVNKVLICSDLIYMSQQNLKVIGMSVPNGAFDVIADGTGTAIAQVCAYILGNSATEQEVMQFQKDIELINRRKDTAGATMESAIQHWRKQQGER